MAEEVAPVSVCGPRPPGGVPAVPGHSAAPEGDALQQQEEVHHGSSQDRPRM
ncbi:hypothetical protein E2C01_098240 [Portunus trituberculatus]|uniref:Uncharacterized protein n=1 Tax=Portunus trituberculatus TaxID=210409 RepID=A0A5B7K7R5_PORTR|nr:hypothetical protein [Portunus trituberculatus]